SMKPLLQAQNLTKKFNHLTAVDNSSFEINQGEIFGLLGPNGAGKTTLIRMLTGILKPNLGQSFLKQINIQTNPTQAQQLMGIVPEMANAYIDISALNNLLLMGELYGLPKKQRVDKALQLLEMFELSHRQHNKVKTFSKGMKQRVIIAMALMNDAEILFLDEPTSGLDVKSTRLIRKLIRNLNQKGQTILLTTHDLNEANMLCDRVAIINHGQIIAIDRPEKLKQTIKTKQGIEIAFEKKIPANKIDFKGVKNVKKIGDKYQIYAESKQDLLEDMIAFSKKSQNKILSIKTLEPSLEEAFIKITQAKK
ncbi:MAG: ATP-binding cassette domain-containing protein, partial [Patescibacteria group bacterium]|nr:ATP-binding cassette domain-containing protein [Patescibacteria group bacterium]